MTIIPSKTFIRLLLPGLILTLFLFESCSSTRKVMVAPIREEGAEYLFLKLKEKELKFNYTVKYPKYIGINAD